LENLLRTNLCANSMLLLFVYCCFAVAKLIILSWSSNDIWRSECLFRNNWSKRLLMVMNRLTQVPKIYLSKYYLVTVEMFH